MLLQTQSLKCCWRRGSGYCGGRNHTHSAVWHLRGHNVRTMHIQCINTYGTWSTVQVPIETWVGCRCGKLLLWSHYPLHNQDSAGRQARYRYIYLLWQQTYLHKDSLTKPNTARNILIYQHVWQADISNYNGVFWTSTPVLMCHLNMKTSRQTQQMIRFYGFAGIHERGCAVKTWKQVRVNTESDAIFN